MKVIEEKSQTKRLMQENMDQLQYKRELEKRQHEMDKDQFNRKIQHDNMYEKLAKDHEDSQKNRQKQELQEWYKDASYRKQQVQQMIREKDKYDHENFMNQ